ncbi:MAG: lipid A deacylase LpxR family protein [Desulfovibrionaceae bacterium]|jgi:hypothetical protein|nr:lipid A deacylase LpxR family protein [Desulfovibrionaceae bacterium]
MPARFARSRATARLLFLPFGLLLAGLLCCVPAPAALAAAAPEDAAVPEADAPLTPRNARTFEFYLENDLFAGSDRHYTNAVEFIYLSPDISRFGHEDSPLPDWLARFAEKLPGANDPDVLHNVSLTLGQHIYTPSYTEAESLVRDDRPYAGWLYLALGLHTKTAHVLDTVELSLGVVGPASLSEYSQEYVHVIINADVPNGWDNQLHNEPTLGFAFQRSWREGGPLGQGPPGTGPWSWDLVPHAGAVMGNAQAYVDAGMQVRVGWNMPAGFGTTPLHPGGAIDAPIASDDPRLNGGWGMFFFLGAEARGVGRNIFLDGNTFESSHSVTKEPLVADFYGGVGLLWDRWRITYTHVVRSREFKGQTVPQSFGSLNIGCVF